MDQQKRNIVIVGGGIIGCTTAYFLTRHPLYNPNLHSITIVEATAIASGASGKAGGLLGLWAYPSCIVPLSYRLHAELAAEHNGTERWGYRKVYCGSLSIKGRSQSEYVNGPGKKDEKEWEKLPKVDGKMKTMAKGMPKDLDWFVQENVRGYREMGTPDTTAQVHPYQFTTSMAELAQEKGAKVLIGSVTELDRSERVVKSVTYKDKASGETHILQATDVIVSAGPWTTHVLPDVPVQATRAHSVTIKANVSNYAVFSQIQLAEGKGKRGGMVVSPEMYARPNGEVYACGEGDHNVPLPTSSDLVQCDLEKCDEIISHVSSISNELRDGEVLVKQACYLPSVLGKGEDGYPVIGKMPQTKGLFLATGHTCWGIQNSCATGKLMSEFVYEGEAKSASIKELDPKSLF